MINKLKSPKTTKGHVRKGRGYGSTSGGHTAGRGTKGQKSRSGYSRPRPGFEGGQMPLSRRLPKTKGFSRGRFEQGRRSYVFQLSELAEAIDGGTVNPVTISQSSLASSKDRKAKYKILFDKDIKTKLNVEGIAVSAKAKEAIEKAGGSVK